MRDGPATLRGGAVSRRAYGRAARGHGGPMRGGGHAALEWGVVSLAASNAARSAAARAKRFTPTSEDPLAKSDSRFVSANNRFDSQTRETPAALL
jgi:hypothetical protein